MKSKTYQRHTHFDDELRLDRIQIVTGGPGSGKTSLVQSRKGPADIVVDLDYLAAAVSLGTVHGDHKGVYSTAWRLFDFLVDQIDAGSLTYDRAWIITTSQAEQIQKKTGGTIIKLDPGLQEALRRIEADDSCTEEEKRRRKDSCLGYYYKKG